MMPAGSEAVNYGNCESLWERVSVKKLKVNLGYRGRGV